MSLWKWPVLLKIVLKTFKELLWWKTSNMLRSPVCVLCLPSSPFLPGPPCQPRDRARLGLLLSIAGSCSEGPLGTTCIGPHELRYRLGGGGEKKILNKMLIICPSRGVTTLPGANSTYKGKYKPRGFLNVFRKFLHPQDGDRNRGKITAIDISWLWVTFWPCWLFTAGVGPQERDCMQGLSSLGNLYFCSLRQIGLCSCHMWGLFIIAICGMKASPGWNVHSCKY